MLLGNLKIGYPYKESVGTKYGSIKLVQTLFLYHAFYIYIYIYFFFLYHVTKCSVLQLYYTFAVMLFQF